MVESWDLIDVAWAPLAASVNWGTTIAARIPRMTTTIKISMSVNARGEDLYE
jgi:galactitol-specific phosphotransferase system IIC component